MPELALNRLDVRSGMNHDASRRVAQVMHSHHRQPTSYQRTLEEPTIPFRSALLSHIAAIRSREHKIVRPFALALLA